MTSSRFPSRELGPRLAVAATVPAETDVLVLGLVPGDDGPQFAPGAVGVTEDQVAELTAGFAAVGATGKAGQVHRIPGSADLGATSVLAVGLGELEDDEAARAEQVRVAAGDAARAIGAGKSVATTLGGVDAAAAAEGAFLGAYTFTEFKSADDEDGDDVDQGPGEVTLLLADDTGADTVARAAKVAKAVATARELINTPPSHLYPESFADRAEALGEAVGLGVEVYDETRLEAEGFGGIIGVGKGSSRPPRLVVLSHRGGGEDAPSVALVGKGITFDTGGISIKPAGGMEDMTSDMSGAAAVVATAALVAELDLPLNVTVYVPMAENMPSATAQRPGDVLTQYGGTTVEVINTDAEGRLVLADAIVLACEQSPDYLIDTATLTGAQMVALGTRTPGVMGTEEFRDRVAAVSQRVGEKGWAMPLPAELRKELDSRVADLANVTPGRWAGMLSAGMFLKQFVAEDVQWAHLDIAGPAFNSAAPYGYITKGGTGVPVRTLIAVLEEIAQG